LAEGMDKKVIKILQLVDPWRLIRYETDLKNFDVTQIKGMRGNKLFVDQFIHHADLFLKEKRLVKSIHKFFTCLENKDKNGRNIYNKEEIVNKILAYAGARNR